MLIVRQCKVGQGHCHKINLFLNSFHLSDGEGYLSIFLHHCCCRDVIVFEIFSAMAFCCMVKDISSKCLPLR